MDFVQTFREHSQEVSAPLKPYFGPPAKIKGTVNFSIGKFKNSKWTNRNRYIGSIWHEFSSGEPLPHPNFQ